MKRRTNTVCARLPRPSRPASGLSRYFPGIDSMRDVEAFRMLFTMFSLFSGSPDGDLAGRFISLFLAARGLDFIPTDSIHQGCVVHELRKDGVLLASFSVAMS